MVEAGAAARCCRSPWPGHSREPGLWARKAGASTPGATGQAGGALGRVLHRGVPLEQLLGFPRASKGSFPIPELLGCGRPEGHRAFLLGVRASGEWGWVIQLLSTFLSIAYKHPRYTWKRDGLTVCFHSFVLFHLTIYGTVCPVLLFLVPGSSCKLLFISTGRLGGRGKAPAEPGTFGFVLWKKAPDVAVASLLKCGAKGETRFIKLVKVSI